MGSRAASASVRLNSGLGMVNQNQGPTTGTPLIRQLRFGLISNLDVFFEVEKLSYFLIRTVFSTDHTLSQVFLEKFDFDPEKVSNFQKK